MVFMVHGIGQRLEKSNLVDDVATFRQITANLAERHLTRYQRGIQRVLFIPCQVDTYFIYITSLLGYLIKYTKCTSLHSCITSSLHSYLTAFSVIQCSILWWTSEIFISELGWGLTWYNLGMQWCNQWCMHPYAYSY